MQQDKMQFKLNPDLIDIDTQEIGFNVTGLDPIERSGFSSFWRSQSGERQSSIFGAVRLRSIGERMYADVKGQPARIDGRPFGVVLEEWLNLYGGFYAEHLAKLEAAETARRESEAIERQKTEERLRAMCGLEASAT